MGEANDIIGAFFALWCEEVHKQKVRRVKKLWNKLLMRFVRN